MTDRLYVRLRYPDAFADSSGGTFVIRSGGRRISGHCSTPEAAWASAAKRLGKPKEKAI